MFSGASKKLTNMTGLGHVGADFWPVLDPNVVKPGFKFTTSLCGRYVESCMDQLNMDRGIEALLFPGPDGAIATERYEMFREGVQLSEAILFLQGALEEKKIDGDLAARVEAGLEARGAAYVNDWWEGQFPRDEGLFALAGEVAAKLAGQVSKAK